MKVKQTILGITLLAVTASSLSAATVIISNVTDGPGDTLFAGADNVPLSSGLVSLGYFNSEAITSRDIDSIAKLRANLVNFTVLTSAAIGTAPSFGPGIFNGYAQQAALTSMGPVTEAPLLGRTIYSIVTFGSSLLQSADNTQFGLWKAGVLTGDTPNEVSISANPKGVTPIIGTVGIVVGDFAGTESTAESRFGTFKLVAVPEPSTVLLCGLGLLGFFRRNRTK